MLAKYWQANNRVITIPEFAVSNLQLCVPCTLAISLLANPYIQYDYSI